MRTRKTKYTNKPVYRLYDYNKMTQMTDGSLASYKTFDDLKKLAEADREYCSGLGNEEE